MVTPERSIDVHHADCDDSSACIFVEGEAPPGLAACLMPRRYRKKPDWWVIDVASVDAPTQQRQSFRLSCSTEGLWGHEGIEVVGPRSSVRIPKRRAELAAPASGPKAMSDAQDAPPPAAKVPRRKLGSRTRILRSSVSHQDEAE
jgi:hypothetical protein